MTKNIVHKEDENECSVCGKKINPGIGICDDCVNGQGKNEGRMGEFWLGA